ncbi:hypothetical protein EJB05_40092, partial [Eragrostis curvula]
MELLRRPLFCGPRKETRGFARRASAGLSMSSSRLTFHTLEPALAAAAEALFRSRSPPRAVLRRARTLHALLVVSSLPSALTPATFLVNQLLALYCRHSAVPDAVALLRSTPHPSVVSYNTVLTALSRSPRHAPHAFRLFRDLHASGLRPTAPSLCAVLRAAGAMHHGRAGGAAHSQAVALGFLASDIVPTALLQMYSACGSPTDANQVFDEMTTRDVVAWNCVMHCDVRYGYLDRALRKFCGMVRIGLVPTESTLSSVLSGCARTRDSCHGRALHGWVVKSEELDPDLPLQNALLDMYCCCGDMESTLRVFQRIEKPDLVSWNTVISGFSGLGDGWNAMDAFVKLKSVPSCEQLAPDEYTFVAVVSAAAAAAALPSVCSGKPLHAQVIKAGWESSVFVGNTLINMYFTNDESVSAQILFDTLTVKDVIMWTEMVAGHAALGEGELALKYFASMLKEGHKVDSFSLSSALNSTADLAGLKQGEMLHAQVIKSGYEGNICVSGSLVDMYAKNGALGGACSVFCTIQKPDLKCWNSMIGGYGNHGDSEMAFKLFSDMIRGGLKPDHVTYISLLSACSHCGLVEKGKFYWFCMMTDGIVPGFKHYTSMVSLLSRVGLLEEAVDLINKSLTAKRYPELWRILLSSCVTFKDLSVGVHAAEQVLEQDPDDISTHVLLSNLYASVGKWDNVAAIRKNIRGLMTEKEPGLSWIEIKKMVHVFSADDECHSQIDDCRDELLRIKGNIEVLDSRDNDLIARDAGTCLDFCLIEDHIRLQDIPSQAKPSCHALCVSPEMGGLYCFCLFLAASVLPHVNGAGGKSLNQICGPADLEALLAFSSGLDRNVTGLVGWGPNDPSCCSWTGVACDLGKVVGLDLSNKSLHGVISSSIASLGSLVAPNLSRNSLRGQPLAELSQLASLRVLDLSANWLSGVFPATGGGFLAIEVLNISGNSFTGLHPSFPDAVNLTVLDISRNRFSGGINASALCLNPIKVLQFSMNQLTGELPPDSSHCKTLYELSLDCNALTGCLPSELYAMLELKRLTLRENQFSGSLGKGLGNLSKLVQIDLSYNRFTGSIPDVFWGLRRLESINLASNGFSGKIPASLARCSMLRVVSLRNNSLSGEISIDFLLM